VAGLTGTLATLSEAEDAVVRGEYGIAKRTFAPSVFGASCLTFRPAAGDVRGGGKRRQSGARRQAVRQSAAGRAYTLCIGHSRPCATAVRFMLCSS
jgi:hypothetical protein